MGGAGGLTVNSAGLELTNWVQMLRGTVCIHFVPFGNVVNPLFPPAMGK